MSDQLGLFLRNKEGEVVLMFIEIASSMVAGSILGATYLKKSGSTNETSKIQMIANNCGLISRDGSTIHLQRKKKHEWGSEYAYRIPLGLSENDFQSKKGAFEDGLNTQRTVEFSFSDLKELNLKRNLIKQMRWLTTKRAKKKEVEISYDGLLKIRVYNEPLTDVLPCSQEILDNCKGWQVPVGETRKGFVTHDFDKIAHMIVAGTTDFGKSNWLNSTIATLVCNKPDDVSFTLIDLKGGLSFARYANTKQCDAVAEDTKQALEALKKVQEKMTETMQRLKKSGHQDVKNAKYQKRHFVIIDEAADAAGDKDIQAAFADIARRGRAIGVRLIYATQYPTAETIQSQVKRNCLGRMCFRIDTGIASRVVLDEEGAESLPMLPGRCIYKSHGKSIAQTPKIEDSFIDEIIKPHIRRDDHDSSHTARDAGGSDTLDIRPTRLS